MPYRLKGIIIAIGAYIILSVMLAPFGSTSGGITTPYWMMPSIVGTPLIFLISIFTGGIMGNFPLYLMVSAFISYSILGAIIGLIIGKIKFKKEI